MVLKVTDCSVKQTTFEKKAVDWNILLYDVAYFMVI